LNDSSFFPERGTDGNHFLMESSLLALEMTLARRPPFTLKTIHEPFFGSSGKWVRRFCPA
jgi:hypothetical protein